MSQPTVDGLMRRLERLERQHARLKLAGALAVLLVASTAVMGQFTLSGPPLVEAEQFIVRDRAGKIRAQLTADGLVVMDAGGVIQARLGIEAGKPVLSLRDADKILWKAP